MAGQKAGRCAVKEFARNDCSFAFDPKTRESGGEQQCSGVRLRVLNFRQRTQRGAAEAEEEQGQAG